MKKRNLIKKMTMGELQLRGAFALGTLNEKERTVDFVLSTGARGLRKPYWADPYYEELEVSEEAIDLSRLNNRAPFMLQHRQLDVDAVVGVIEKAWIESGELRITVRFGKDEVSDRYFKKVIDGILGKTSVGYNVDKYQLVEQTEGDYPVYRAVKWTPMEASLVAIAFDDHAQSRSKQSSHQLYECELEIRTHNEEESMDPKEDKNKSNPAPAPTADPQARATQAAAAEGEKTGAEKERKRVIEIQRAVKKAKLGNEFADELIAEGVAIDECRSRIIDAFAEAESKDPVNNKVRVEITTDERDHLRSGMEQALLYRCDSGKYKLDERGQRFANMSLLRMCEELVSKASTLSRSELAERALSTSDLANITANVLRKRLADGYMNWNRTFVPFVSFADLPDFKSVDIDKFGGLSNLGEVPEGGEYEEGTVTDEKESYRLSKYGRIITFTEEMIINDDLRALNKIPRLAGQASARLEGKLVYGQLTGAQVMGDGKTLFHADHKNLAAAGAAIGDTSLSAMRKLGREQKFGEELLNVEFKYLVCGTAKEVEALKILRQVVVPTKTSDSNVFFGTMTPIVDPNITGNQWFTIADPGVAETIEVGYLLGTNRMPVVTSKEDFRSGGLAFKVRHIVKAKAADWRGMAKNPGN